MYIKYFCLSFILFSAAITAFSQDTTNIKEVVITENRLQIPLSQMSRSIEVITQHEIRTAPVNSIAELLNYVAGVDVRQRGPMGAQSDLTIRGSSFDQTLVLINGVKLADPQTGHHALNLPIDLENIERIEVIKGPAARVYGQNAFAGAINIVTKTEDKGYVTAGLQAGDFDLTGGRITASIPSGFFRQRVSASYMQSGGHRPNSDFNSLNLFYIANVPVSDENDINIMAGYHQKGFGASGFYASTNTSNEREFIQTNFIAADLPYKKGKWTHTPRVSWRRHQDEYFFNYLNDSTRAATRNFTLTHILSAEWNSRQKNKYGTTGIGAQADGILYFNQRLGNHSRTVLSLFAEHRFELFKQKIDITPGFLASYYTDFGPTLMPGVDVGVSLTPWLRLFGNYGRTFRVPTYTDLYLFNAANLNNPSLKPEQANVYEGGLKVNHGGLRLQASYFVRDAQNMIDRTKNEASELWIPTNLNSLIVRGIDAQAAYRFKWLGGGQLQAGYMYLGDYEFTKAQALSRYALDFLTSQLSLGFESGIVGNLRHSIRVRHNKRLNQETAYTVLDARLMYRISNLTMFAQASNILDEVYAEQNNIPMPTRWFMCGVQYRFDFKEKEE